MRKYLLIEAMKLKRSTIKKAAIILPVLCLILGVGFCMLGGAQVMAMADITTVNHWGLIWLPAGIAILTGMMQRYEKKSTGYQLIDGTDTPAHLIWISKCVVIAAALLAATLFLWCGIFAYDLFALGSGGSLVFRCLAALLLSWLAVLWQIPVYLLLAQKIPYPLLMMISCLLALEIGPIQAVTSHWWIIPWAWILRLQAPIIGVHPNGIPLVEGDRLLQYTGFARSIAGIIILAILAVAVTSWLFTRRRMRG